MTKPIIGVTAFGLLVNDAEREAVNKSYIRAMIGAGAIPVIIPNLLEQVDWDGLYRRLDGILFTGGGDIQTMIFDGQPHSRVGGVDEARDALEFPLMRRVVAEGKPFLGICRGLQVANVALGGTLYTHIEDQLPGAIKHDYYPDIPRDFPAHPIRVDEGSRLSGILHEPILIVNSLHHQGIEKLSPQWKPVAYAPDGLIEAIEMPDHPFALAVQWHPEELPEREEMRALFRAFVQATLQYASSTLPNRNL
jgi:putative glutamine amidotransferase